MKRIQRQICALCDKELSPKPVPSGAPEIMYVSVGCPCVRGRGGDQWKPARPKRKTLELTKE